MRAFLIKLLLAAVFMVVCYIAAVAFVGIVKPKGIPNVPYFLGSYGHLHSRAQEAATYGDVDVLVLGSSRAYRGFDPRIFEQHGIRMFNLGSSAQTTVQSLCLAKQYLDTLNPELVVIEVYPKGFTSDGVESAIDLVTNNKIDSHVLKMVWKVNHIKVYNVLIVGAVRNLLGMDDGFQEPVQMGKDRYVSGGFVEKNKFKNEKLVPPNDRELEFREQNIRALKELVQFLKKNGKDVVLVEAPYTEIRYNSLLNRDEMEEVHQDLATYVNFNKRLNLSDTLHFYDQSHLNQRGVEIFNEAFIEWLHEVGHLHALKKD